MSVFDDDVREGTRQILEEAGDPASFTALDAAPIPVTVILDRDVERTVAGMQGAMMETRTELTGYSAVLRHGGRGDVVTLNGKGWRLAQKASDDGYLVTWIVTEERSP